MTKRKGHLARDWPLTSKRQSCYKLGCVLGKKERGSWRRALGHLGITEG
jgi:hypothetical protein